MQHTRNIEVGSYHHVYSRGVNKVDIFSEDIDYNRFQLLISNCNSIKNIRIKEILTDKKEEHRSEKIVTVFCYCLMPNHFHMIIQELIPGGISLFFQKVLSGYSTYFNKKYSRTGALFGSRFKNKIVHDDAYFSHLIKYIWNNPIKIISPNYSSQDLLHGKIVLSKKERIYAKQYPFKYFRGRT